MPIFLLELEVLDINIPISGQLVFNAQVCSKICVPIKKIFNLTSFDNKYKNINLLNFDKINKYLLKVPLLSKDNKLVRFKLIVMLKKLKKFLI